MERNETLAAHAVPGKRLAVNYDPSCRERNYGLWEGRTIQEAKNLSDGNKQADDKYAMDYAPAGGVLLAPADGSPCLALAIAACYRFVAQCFPNIHPVL